MTALRFSPNKDVRDEAHILERLGFHYTGQTSNGHLRFQHERYGEHVMACTPSARYWRRANRRQLAALMGIDVPALTALIAGQASVGKRTNVHRRPPRGRRRAPRGLRHLTAAPDITTPEPVSPPVPRPVFDPADPITERRRVLWAAAAAERDRANAECRFPWRDAA